MRKMLKIFGFWICACGFVCFFPLVCRFLFHEFDPLLIDTYIVMYSWWIACLHAYFGIESSHSAFLCSFCTVYHFLCFFCLCFYILIVSYRRYLIVRACFFSTQPDSFCLLVVMFSLFTWSVVIDTVGFPLVPLGYFFLSVQFIVF